MKQPAIQIPEGCHEVLLHACCAPCSSAIVEWMLAHDVPIEHVSKMLGHTNIIQTQRYAKVQPKSVFSDFDRMADELGGKAAVAQQQTQQKKRKKSNSKKI